MHTELFSLKGKVAFVTGASSGLGRHFALTLAKAGADVVVAARRLEQLKALASEIEALGQKAFPVKLDVTHSENIKDAIEGALSVMGKIDILVNSAGNPQYRKNSLEYTEEEWDSLIDTHLKGSWLVSQAVAKKMISQQTKGSIINISSALGQHSRKNALVYSVAKAGVSQMTRALALDLAEHHIRVNAIAPGWFVTDFNREILDTEVGRQIKSRIPVARTGELQELEGPLLLLASEASSYITGSILNIDGGYATHQI